MLPDGSRNGFRIDRLKDKLGDRSNASSEIVLDGALAQLVGEEGRGVRRSSRWSSTPGSTASSARRPGCGRRWKQATHHAAHRTAFGSPLAEKPLMRNVLADLCIESEAATVTALRLARAYDRRAHDPAEAAFARLATAVAKYWICKRGPGHAAEALECLGGNGYVEESGAAAGLPPAAAPLDLGGAGNVVCLDVAPDAAPGARVGGDVPRGDPPRRRAGADGARGGRARRRREEGQARAVVERLALALQGSLLVRHAPAAVAGAFLASRLGRQAWATAPSAPRSIRPLSSNAIRR